MHSFVCAGLRKLNERRYGARPWSGRRGARYWKFAEGNMPLKVLINSIYRGELSISSGKCAYSWSSNSSSISSSAVSADSWCNDRDVVHPSRVEGLLPIAVLTWGNRNRSTIFLGNDEMTMNCFVSGWWHDDKNGYVVLQLWGRVEDKWIRWTQKNFSSR